MNRDLTTRDAAEELWLWRKSRGATQRRAAEALGVGRNRLQAAERDAAHALPDAPWRPIRAVPTPLLLALARRRSGLGLRGVAAAAGISHRTVILWERSGADPLVAWWERRGFTFARLRP